METNDISFIAELESIIESRKSATANTSYTRELFDKGTPFIAQKVGEEAVELSIAAVQGNEDEIRAEAADLVYHLLVLLSNSGLKFSDIAAELSQRHR